MFLDELADAERLLREHPEAGIAYAARTRAGIVRRILLAGTKHHLYYRYRADRDELVVLAMGRDTRARAEALSVRRRRLHRNRRMDRKCRRSLASRPCLS